MSEHTTETAAAAPAVGHGPGPRAFLRQVHPHPETRAVEGTVRVGRKPGRGGWTCADRKMSRAHFEVRLASSGGGVQVTDLGAKNPTRVDGRPTERVYVGDGSVVRAGESVFVVELRTPPVAGLGAPETGVSAALSWAHQVIDKVAQTTLTVTIHGPSGAGKERLARRVHEHSGRRGPFVPVNCTTLPRELAASELFGHVRGAFSGAESRSGLFAAAAGGTLFLDEVGDLPADVQPMLLRALQERSVRPVGGDRERAVDVRVVAATHQDLPAAVTDGRFRADLLARLTGFEVTLPGLTERRADVPPIFTELVGRPLAADAAEALLLADWPTNVRGLQQLAARIQLFADAQGRVELGLLPGAMQDLIARQPVAEVAPDELRQLLATHAGNVSRVARAAGLSRQALYRRLEALGLDPASFR